MTKEITKAYILQQVQDKFKLRDLTPDVFAFSETVIPVYNVEQHLEAWWNQYKEASVTVAGAKLMFTVPDNEKWLLRAYDVIFMGAGAYTVSGVFLVRVHRDPDAAVIYLDLEAAQNTSYHIELYTPVTLEPGDELKVNVDGYTSTQDIRLYIDYKKEIIR